MPSINIIEKIKKYKTENKVKRIILRMIAQSVLITDREKLVEIFFSLHPIYSGALTVEGLKKKLDGTLSDQCIEGNLEYNIRNSK